MSARDDYAHLTLLERYDSIDSRGHAGNDAGRALDELDRLRAEIARVSHALAADSVLEMVTRLSNAADIYDPADDYLLNAARALTDGMVP